MMRSQKILIKKKFNRSLHMLQLKHMVLYNRQYNSRFQ